MTKTTRLLLPFTDGVEMDTIEAAVLLAVSHHATLVSLSLILTPQTRGKGVRLEHIQRSKDFLEAVQQKALGHHVPLERFEVFTGDRVQSMLVLADQLGCDGILLALRGRNGSLLDAGMIEQLMAMRFCPLYLIYLPARESCWIARLRERLSHWRLGHRRRADQHMPRQPACKEEVGQEAALSGYAGVLSSHDEAREGVDIMIEKDRPTAEGNRQSRLGKLQLPDEADPSLLLKERDVRTYLPPGDLLLVELDYLQIDQVLTNLLENAARYTPAESPIEVSAHIAGGQVGDQRGRPRSGYSRQRTYTRVRQVLPRPEREAPCQLPHGIGSEIGRMQGAGRGPLRAH